ncbi:FliH/SctL family protein [Ferrimonas marina]|uniref:Flagellar assembly protein FliH n=1 Tax=Ferrimonas marina TaxID=299255 RepID=A0A1M5YEQ8_9GAMM|nr:FliH/SctL family protein [Ferrimonas marina]SHI10507.1 Flagellar assembly protein FliH [Ferrimonas marina]
MPSGPAISTLNPEDLELVKTSFGDEQIQQRQWQLQAEPQLTQGSLQIRTERSQVPMLEEDRLRKVLEQFAGSPRAAAQEPEYPKPEPVAAPSATPARPEADAEASDATQPEPPAQSPDNPVEASGETPTDTPTEHR